MTVMVSKLPPDEQQYERLYRSARARARDQWGHGWRLLGKDTRHAYVLAEIAYTVNQMEPEGAHRVGPGLIRWAITRLNDTED